MFKIIIFAVDFKSVWNLKLRSKLISLIPVVSPSLWSKEPLKNCWSNRWRIAQRHDFPRVNWYYEWIHLNGLSVFFKFIGVYSCFTVLYLMSVVQQDESAVHIHISPLFYICFAFRSPQSIEESSLCSTVGSHSLSILYMASNIHCKPPPWPRAFLLLCRLSSTPFNKDTFCFFSVLNPLTFCHLQDSVQCLRWPRLSPVLQLALTPSFSLTILCPACWKPSPLDPSLASCSPSSKCCVCCQLPWWLSAGVFTLATWLVL